MSATLLLTVALLLPSELTEALERYDFGEFEAACQQLDALRDADGFDAEARLKTLKYLGACRHALRDDAAADEAWTALLALDPTATLDPVQFPPDMVRFFGKVRGRAEAAARERAAAEARAKAEAEAEARRRAAEKAEPPPPPRRRDAPPAKSRGKAMLPFGVGQFQNGHDAKGATLAALQGVALAVGVGGLLTFESEKESGGFLAGGTFPDPDRADTLQAVYLGGFAAFGALWLYGLIDANVYFDQPPPVAVLPTPDGLAIGGVW